MSELEVGPADEHFRAIGRITVSFSFLEAMISLFVWSLIGEDQRLGQVITAKLSFRQLLDLLSSLYRYRADNPELIEELDTLVTEAAQAAQRRNLVAHSFWAAGDTHETITRVKMTTKRKKGLRLQFGQMSVQDLDEIADFIAEVATRITQFMSRIGITD